MQDKQNILCDICIETDNPAESAGRMHQLRRHMALLGHPVLGDTKYTYGYAKRHPDAAIQLQAAQAQQAMSAPFGVSSEHPLVQKDSDDKSKYECSICHSACSAMFSACSLTVCCVISTAQAAAAGLCLLLSQIPCLYMTQASGPLQFLACRVKH